MMANVVSVYLLTFALVGVSARAGAQTATRTTGAIFGRIVTGSSRVAGVAVTISGKPLPAPRTTSSTVSGTYRFSLVPPGSYSIRFEAGNPYPPVTCEPVEVLVGLIISVDVTLAQRGSMCSSNRAATHNRSPALVTTFDGARLVTLPDTGDLAGLAADAPGVRPRANTDPNKAGADVPVHVFGTRAQGRSIIEGIITELQPSPGTLSPDFRLFDQVSIETAAHSAAVPQAGLETVSISRSGIDGYHGTFDAVASAPWRAANIDTDQVRQGLRTGPGLSPLSANGIEEFRSLSGDIGGFLKRTSSWWYFSIRDEDVSQRRRNLMPTPYRIGLFNYSGKGTFRTSASDLFIVYAQVGRRHEPTRLEGFVIGPAMAVHPTVASTSDRKDWSWVSKAEYRKTWNDVAVELRAGQFGYDWRDVPNGGGPRREDLTTLEVFGSNLETQRSPRRNQATAVLSRSFKAFGDHDFTGGVDVLRENAHQETTEGYAGGVVHIFNNGQPSEVYLVETPSRSDAGLWTMSGYVSDAWRPVGRATLTLGLRVDRYRGFLPAQSHPANLFRADTIRFTARPNLFQWTLPSPRIGAAFDLTRQGGALLGVSYGTYWSNPGINLTSAVNPNAPLWWHRYTWTDINTNGVWDTAEQGQLLASRGGTSAETLDPALRDSFTRELALWLTTRLGRTNLRAGYVWRGERRHYQRENANQPYGAFVPTSISDAGPDGLAGTADDGGQIVVYNLRSELRDVPPLYVTRNVPGANSDYRTWEVTATSRVSRRSTVTGTLTYTTSQDQGRSFAGNLVRDNEFPATPNDLLHATAAGAYRSAVWSGRVDGVYEMPFGIRAVPVFRYDAGQPFGRTLLAALNYGTVPLLVEPIGTRRQRATAMMDIRVQKGFALSRNGRVTAVLDVFNLFNANPEETLDWRSGPSFLAPSGIAAPRAVRFGIRLDR